LTVECLPTFHFLNRKGADIMKKKDLLISFL